MPTVRLEHGISDFDTWKTAFDRDPINRERSGVRSYRVYRPVEDPQAVAVDLEFDTLDEARRFQDALRELWRSPEAARALAGNPQVQIVDTVEWKAY